MNLVRKFPAPNRAPAFAGASGVTRLDHETLDVTMEEVVVVVVGSSETKEVLKIKIKNEHSFGKR